MAMARQAFGVSVAGALACLLAGCGHGEDAGQSWALLVATSAGVENGYAAQASVCHAYHLLVSSGYSPDRVITMMPDDVATAASNLWPGKLFNAKSANQSEDVRQNCTINYWNTSVTNTTLMHILRGNKVSNSSVANVSRVLESGPNDDVFVYIVGEGEEEALKFSDGTKLGAQELVGALADMYKAKLFKQLVLFLDSRFSGSVVANISTRKELPVYVLASSAAEVGQGVESNKTYCGTWTGVDNKSMDACLGTLFSAHWMAAIEGIEQNKTMTFGELYRKVHEEVANVTKNQNVSVYGQTSEFFNEAVSKFLGNTSAVSSGARAFQDAELDRLYGQYARSRTDAAAQALAHGVEAHLAAGLPDLVLTV